jgi:Concanavalin A-like lectin/glucanases superfamily
LNLAKLGAQWMAMRSVRFQHIRCLAALPLTLTATAAAQSNAAIRFFGTGSNQQDRIRIAIDDNAPGSDASTVCDLGAGSFTIEFWLRGFLADNATTSFGGDVEVAGIPWIEGNMVVDRDIWGGSDRDFGISLAGGRVRFGTGRANGTAGADTESTIEGSVQVLDGAWHHIACVRDVATGRKRIIIDGTLDFESINLLSNDDLSYPNDGAPNSVTPWNPYIVLGAEKHDAGPDYPSFAGWFDELRLWSRARSIAEIAADRMLVLPVQVLGLVGYYRFEEVAGTAVSDSGGAGAPAGLLIAGAPGNGEWALQATDPLNTAPIEEAFAPEDLDEDGDVDGADLAALLGAWGSCSGCPADLHPDGAVDAADLALLLGAWTGSL